MPRCGIQTRRERELFLLGSARPSMKCGGKLPLKLDALCYLKHRQSNEAKKNKPIGEVICCNIVWGTHTASCNQPGGCIEEASDMCVVAAVKENWIKAELPIVSDFTIKKYIMNLNNDWKSLEKRWRCKCTPTGSPN